MARKPKLNELHDSYRAVFNTKDGERVLEHLSKVCFLDVTSFTPGDPHSTSFKEGQRSIVLQILKFIERDPKVILRLIAGENYE